MGPHLGPELVNESQRGGVEGADIMNQTESPGSATLLHIVHAILHYGEVPLGPLELRIKPNLAAFRCATCQTEEALEMN